MTQRHIATLFSSCIVFQREVTFLGVVGLTDDGLIPGSLEEECHNAVTRIKHILLAHRLTTADMRHLTYTLTGSNGFHVCQRILAEALGSAQLSMTLRVKPLVACEEQRLAFDLVVEIPRGTVLLLQRESSDTRDLQSV